MQALKYSTARIVQEYLIDEGIGLAYSTTAKWAVASNLVYEKPQDLICVYDEQTRKRARMADRTNLDDPVVSIHIRGVDYAESYAKGIEIMEAMDALRRHRWDGVTQYAVFKQASRQRGLLPFGRNKNELWTFNLEYYLVINEIGDQ